MLGKGIKRFYKQSGVEPTSGGFGIILDGKPVKTPLGMRLEVPAAALAQAIAAEWDAQDKDVKPASMPLTQLASTALDRVGPERAAISAQLMNYAATDLLCYRADFPPALVERQARDWQPLMDWLRDHVGSELIVTEGIIAVEQPTAAFQALSRYMDGLDVWHLTAAQSACAATGSLVLALALAADRIDGETAYLLSQLDETYQAEQWGEDYEAADRRAALKADILAAASLLALCKAK